MAVARRTVSEAARLDTEKELKRRDEALAKINESEGFKRIYEAERDAYARQVEDNLLFYWDRGRAATDVKRTAEYGQGAIDLLADALMVDRSLVYKTITLFAMYPERSALQAKMEEAISKGYKLTWSHMSLIVHVPEAKSGADIHSKRHQMVQLVIDHGLTVRATQDEIMSRYRDDPQAGEGGDGSSPPRSLSGVLKQMANFSTKAMEKLSESFDDISGRLHQTTGDKVNDAVIDTMSSDAEALKKLGEKCREASVTLEREATRLRREKAKAKPAETGNGKTAKKAGGRTPGRSRASS